MIKRIGFIYALSSGHKKAADSLLKAAVLLNQRFCGFSIDIFKFLHPFLREVFYSFNLWMLKEAPQIWGFCYNSQPLHRRLVVFKKAIDYLEALRVKNLIFTHGFEVVVCTHAFPCGIFSALKKRLKINLPVVAVLTDFNINPFWVQENIDLYIVPDESTFKRLVDFGVQPEKIEVVGIPIDPNFGLKKNSQKIISKFNILKDCPTVLIMGGSFGLGPIEEIILSLNKINKDFQIIVVSGYNACLKKRIENIAPLLKKRIKVFGYVDRIDELMSVSDILISKPGGITCAESLASGLPMIIFDPLPTQERFNANFLLEHKVALYADTLDFLESLVSDFLDEPTKLEQIKRRLTAYAKPFSSFEAIRSIERRLFKRCN
jgi:processive 1,2-diacylglycerol beta-glucosyltransferase